MDASTPDPSPPRPTRAPLGVDRQSVRHALHQLRRRGFPPHGPAGERARRLVAFLETSWAEVRAASET